MTTALAKIEDEGMTHAHAHTHRERETGGGQTVITWTGGDGWRFTETAVQVLEKVYQSL